MTVIELLHPRVGRFHEGGFTVEVLVLSKEFAGLEGSILGKRDK